MEYLKVELRKGQADVQRVHQESLDRLNADCARIQRRLDQMYVDKLDGLIDADTYARNTRQGQDELRAYRRSMSKHDEAKQSYLEDGLRIVALAQEAPTLFEQASREDKRELLNHLRSNSSWAGGKLTIEWRKPYLFLAEFQNPESDEPPSGSDSEGGPSEMVGLVERISNWLAMLTEDEVAWAQRGLRVA
jgi:site-specific DNA recombinase